MFVKFSRRKKIMQRYRTLHCTNFKKFSFYLRWKIFINFFREIFILIASSSWGAICIGSIFTYMIVRTIYSLFIYVKSF